MGGSKETLRAHAHKHPRIGHASPLKQGLPTHHTHAVPARVNWDRVGFPSQPEAHPHKHGPVQTYGHTGTGHVHTHSLAGPKPQQKTTGSSSRGSSGKIAQLGAPL